MKLSQSYGASTAIEEHTDRAIYLPPVTDKRAPPQIGQTGPHFIYLDRRDEGLLKVDLGGWLCTEIVYHSADSHHSILDVIGPGEQRLLSVESSRLVIICHVSAC